MKINRFASIKCISFIYINILVKNDIFIAISTSGNSENIIRAIYMAKNRNMKIIGMTGKDGGKMKEICDILLWVPHNRTARIQEIHEHTIHTLCQLIEQKIAKD